MRLGPRRTSRRTGLPAPWDWLELPPIRRPLPGSLPRRRTTAVADVPHVRGLAPGESLEDALAAYEAQIAAQEEAALEATAAAGTAA